MGQSLQHLRRAAGLTQEEMAERIGLSYDYVRDLERGTRNLRLETIEALATKYAVDPVALLDGSLLDQPAEPRST